MNFCKIFRENAGKKVSVTMKDGEILSGKLMLYISAVDNEPERESVGVDNIEIYTDEIKYIEIKE